MFGLFRKKHVKRPAVRDLPHSSPFGEPPYEWQPSRTVLPTYSLLPQDHAEFAEFMERASKSVSWQRSETYAAGEGEPRLDNIDVDFWWWARIEGELWVLAEGVWAYFPDPLPYSLSIKGQSDRRFRNLGHFGEMPPAWSGGPIKVQS